MDLHGQIMNLPTPAVVENLPYGRRMAYKTAHRDARHAAAELALQADAAIDMLAEALCDMMAGIADHDIGNHTGFGPADCKRLADAKAWAVNHQRQRTAAVG